MEAKNIEKFDSWPKAAIMIANIALEGFKLYLSKNEDDRLKKIEAEMISIRNGLAFKS